MLLYDLAVLVAARLAGRAAAGASRAGARAVPVGRGGADGRNGRRTAPPDLM